MSILCSFKGFKFCGGHFDLFPSKDYNNPYQSWIRQANREIKEPQEHAQESETHSFRHLGVSQKD